MMRSPAAIVDGLADEIVVMAGAMLRRLHLTRTDPDVVLGGGVFRTDEPRFQRGSARASPRSRPKARVIELTGATGRRRRAAWTRYCSPAVRSRPTSAQPCAPRSATWDAEVQRSVSGPPASKDPTRARRDRAARSDRRLRPPQRAPQPIRHPKRRREIGAVEASRDEAGTERVAGTDRIHDASRPGMPLGHGRGSRRAPGPSAPSCPSLATADRVSLLDEGRQAPRLGRRPDRHR